MKPAALLRLSGLAAAGYLALTLAAAAAPNATMNHDANVRATPEPSSDIVNFVELDQDVQVTSCTPTRCKLHISGPDGWVKKAYLDFWDDEEEPAPPAPPPAPPAPPPLPYGPDTCLDGYVWRDAIPGDHVCVTPDRRTLAAQENGVAGARVDPGGAYGPNSCLSGYVWREAYVGDVVCVVPDRRSQVAQENADGPSHRVLH